MAFEEQVESCVLLLYSEMFEKAGGSVSGSVVSAHSNITSQRQPHPSNDYQQYRQSELEAPPPYTESGQPSLHPPIQPTTTYTANQRAGASSQVGYVNTIMEYSVNRVVFSFLYTVLVFHFFCT